MTRAEMHAFEGTGQQWDELAAGLPGAHLLQTWEWAQVKAAYGWEPMPLVWRTASSRNATNDEKEAVRGIVVGAAMVLRRPILRRGFARRLCILYVPKGPLLNPTDSLFRAQLLGDLEALGRQQNAVLVKIDPDVELGRGYPGVHQNSDDPVGSAWPEMMTGRGWRFSDSQIQFRNSVWIDLSESEDGILARMKPKTRYNIRLAERKGVSVRTGGREDIAHLYRMYAETADRDGFVIRSEAYFQSVWGDFLAAPQDASKPAAEALVAEVAGEPVAALLLFYFAQRAYYLYGMSRGAHRDKMPNHLLQWDAIRRAKLRGCRTYDLWGAPDEFEESDPMWGVFRFKEGFGGTVVRTIGAWDFPSGGLWYRLYTHFVPKALAVMRWRGRKRIHDAFGGA